MLEDHLGWAGKGIGQRIGDMLQQQAKVAELRKFLDEPTTSREQDRPPGQPLDDADVSRWRNLAKGVPARDAGVRRCR